MSALTWVFLIWAIGFALAVTWFIQRYRRDR